MELRQSIIALFDQLLEPKLEWNINALNLLKEIEIKDGQVKVVVNLITEDKDQNQNF